MDIHTAAKYMQHGYRIQRSIWKSTTAWIDSRTISFIEFEIEDLLADDWVIITEGIISDFPLKYADS